MVTSLERRAHMGPNDEMPRSTVFALIQILGEGDDIRVVTTSTDPVQLMIRAKVEAEEVAKAWFEDTRIDFPDSTRPKVNTRFFGTSLHSFTAEIEVEGLGNAWNVSPVMEQLR
jgi:hypothetical protein